jgi:hypothetical protein
VLEGGEPESVVEGTDSDSELGELKGTDSDSELGGLEGTEPDSETDGTGAVA